MHYLSICRRTKKQAETESKFLKRQRWLKKTMSHSYTTETPLIRVIRELQEKKRRRSDSSWETWCKCRRKERCFASLLIFFMFFGWFHSVCFKGFPKIRLRMIHIASTSWIEGSRLGVEGNPRYFHVFHPKIETIQTKTRLVAGTLKKYLNLLKCSSKYQTTHLKPIETSTTRTPLRASYLGAASAVLLTTHSMEEAEVRSCSGLPWESLAVNFFLDFGSWTILDSWMLKDWVGHCSQQNCYGMPCDARQGT